MKPTKTIESETDFYQYLFGKWEHGTMNIINQDVAVATLEDNNEFTEHSTSNVYISAFITAHARMNLYKESIKPLGHRVIYFDKDSCIYVSETGDHLIPLDTTGALGLCTSEARTADDYFTEFVSCGPKSYALKSVNGDQDICKCKGFSSTSRIKKTSTLTLSKSRYSAKHWGSPFPTWSFTRGKCS